MKIAIYTRKSVNSERGESVKNQIKMCKEYVFKKFDGIKKENIIILQDEAYSGKNFNRPAFRYALDLIENKKIDFLVCYRLDRVSRNVLDFASLIQKFEKNNIGFISIKEEFDSSKPMGKAMLYMASVFSQLERETIAERVKDNMIEIAKKGYWLGGTAPTGYKSYSVKAKGKIKHLLKEDFVYLERVKLIYIKMLELKSVSKVQAYLKENEVKSINGKNFSKNSIRQILLNPVYCKAGKEIFKYFKNLNCTVCFKPNDLPKEYGISVYNRKSCLNNVGYKNKNWIISIGKHKGIVSAKDWIYIQSFFKTKEHKPHNEVALLSGKIFCNICGGKMIFKAHTNFRNNKIFYYICKNKILNGARFCSAKNLRGDLLDTQIFCEISSKVIKTKFKELRYNKEYFNNIDKNIALQENILKTKDLNSLCIEENLNSELILNNINTLKTEKEIFEKKLSNTSEISIYDKRNLIQKYVLKINLERNNIEIVYKNGCF